LRGSRGSNSAVAGRFTSDCGVTRWKPQHRLVWRGAIAYDVWTCSNQLSWTHKNMSNDNLTDITLKQVRGYLRDHPTFLDENPDILETMIVHHKTDGAVSLIERQLSVLRDRNKEIGDQLDLLVETAQNNELMFEKTRQLVINLLEAPDLPALVETLYESLGIDFDIESFSLTLFANEKKLKKMMAKVTSFEDAKTQVPALIDLDRSICGPRQDSEVDFLFGESHQPIKSVAAVIIRKETTFGILSLGNSDPEFYSSDMGTLFLDYVADVLGRLLSQHLEVKS
jgi:uncharacterized protein YigA (DUF484 family)